MTGAAMTLASKRVVVIGGSSGIGFSIAQACQDLGAQVVIASSNPANVDAAVERLPGASGRVVDLREEDGVAAFFQALGAFDHLAVTAGDWGGSMFVPTGDIDLASARDGLAIRFWGVLAVVKHASRVIAPDGSITLTSGMLTHRPIKGSAFATAGGGAVEHLARGLAIDLAPVRVNAVCPGLVLTDQVKKMPPEMLKMFVAGLPLQRAATPAEAAAAYAYVMLNGYVTGQVLPVDGGGSVV
jgi:NAD(P)-dependent dehydrogenase (short-subunit alcohol dehydrogenase family)